MMTPENITIAAVAFCVGSVAAFSVELWGLKRFFLRHDAATTSILEGVNARLDAVASSLLTQNEKLNKLADALARTEMVLGATNRVAQTMRDEARQLTKDSAAIVKAVDIVDRRTNAIRRDYSFVDEKLASIWNAINGIWREKSTFLDVPRGEFHGHCGICGKMLRYDEDNAWLPGDGSVKRQCDGCKATADRFEGEGDETEVEDGKH